MAKQKRSARGQQTKSPGRTRVRNNASAKAGTKKRRTSKGGPLLPPVSLRTTAKKDTQTGPGKRKGLVTPRRIFKPAPRLVETEKPSPDLMRRLFSECGFEPTELQINLFWQYYLRIKARNQEINITRIHSFQDTVVKHFVDCAMVGVLTKLPAPLMDLGSGGGFPGVPLKILYPEVDIILAEGRHLRVEFLEEVRKSLRLPKLFIHPHNVQPKHTEPQVSGVITRAVETVPRTLMRVAGCLKKGGHVILMKGPKVNPEIREAKAIKQYELIEDHAYILPSTDHKRRLVIYKRV